jgi:hypothetical protein
MILQHSILPLGYQSETDNSLAAENAIPARYGVMFVQSIHATAQYKISKTARTTPNTCDEAWYSLEQTVWTLVGTACGVMQWFTFDGQRTL